jgi:hypothetical protein
VDVSKYVSRVVVYCDSSEAISAEVTLFLDSVDVDVDAVVNKREEVSNA